LSIQERLSLYKIVPETKLDYLTTSKTISEKCGLTLSPKKYFRYVLN
jgi:hypothetical protein